VHFVLSLIETSKNTSQVMTYYPAIRPAVQP